MNNIKQKIIDEIEKNVSVFYRISSVQYRIRCPICGDSQTNPRDAHLYLKCSFDPNEPILYNCFKCPAKGRVTKKFLDKLHINVNEIAGIDNQLYNRIPSIKSTSVDIITGSPIMDSKQVQYIERRLGYGFTDNDYDRFKIIWNINSIIPYITDARIKNTIPSNIDSISFLSDDKSTMLTRFFVDDEPRWRKTKFYPSENKSFYTIKSTLDLFSSDTIVVNIGEGIFDILSVYKNFNDGNNSIYIATLGSDYESGVEYAIGNGFIGSNILLKIYIDDNIDERALKFQMKKYKWIFDKIFIYKNIKADDFGHNINDIKPIEYQV